MFRACRRKSVGERGEHGVVRITSLLRSSALGLSAALLMSGCSWLGLDPGPSPKPATPSTSAAPKPSPSGSVTPDSNPSVKATGSMYLFKNLVSKQLLGTCERVDGAPTLSLADLNNDFFDGVQVSVVLQDKQVASLSATFGEDSEGIARRMEFDANMPDKGASAAVSITENTYKVTGKTVMYEDGMAGELTPFTIVVKCSSGDW